MVRTWLLRSAAVCRFHGASTAVNPLTSEGRVWRPAQPLRAGAHPLRLGDRIAGQHEHSGGRRIQTAGTGAGDRDPVGASELLQLRSQRREVFPAAALMTSSVGWIARDASTRLVVGVSLPRKSIRQPRFRSASPNTIRPRSCRSPRRAGEQRPRPSAAPQPRASPTAVRAGGSTRSAPGPPRARRAPNALRVRGGRERDLRQQRVESRNRE